MQNGLCLLKERLGYLEKHGPQHVYGITHQDRLILVVSLKKKERNLENREHCFNSLIQFRLSGMPCSLAY